MHPIEEIENTPNLAFGNDNAFGNLMNKTGPNFPKSNRTFEETIDSEALGENSYV